jgi:hypothetical protein
MRRKMRQLGSKRKNCRLLVDDLAYPERYRRGCYGRHPCCFIACCLCSTSVFTKLLPRHMYISSLSFVSALGSSGGAVWPFLTGILS